jgi:trimeric autotransporter adhesin
MSKFAVKGAATGTGTFTLESPATNTDRTFTLPDTDGSFITADGSGNVTISGGLTLTSGTANGVTYLNGSKLLTSGSVLTFDGAQLGVNGITVGRGAGAVATNTAVGASALAANTSGADNVAIGRSAASGATTASFGTYVGSLSGNAGITGNNNTALGYYAYGSGSSGANNTALGVQALYLNTTASNNTAVGYQSGYSNTTGTITAFGALAGYANTTGVENTAIGNTSLRFNTTGNANSALGLFALYANTTGANNVAVGRSALESNTTASNNVVVGYQAGYSVTTGPKNTFVGMSAGRSATTGSDNTFVGIESGQLITTGAKNTIIGGYNGNYGGLDIRTASNNIVLSDGDGNPRACYTDAGGNFTWSFSQQATPVRINASEVMQIDTNALGYGIMVTGTSGTVAMRFYNQTPSSVAGQISFTGTTTTYGTSSDYRLKENVQPMQGALATVARLKPVTYKWKADGLDGQGFIAHELQEVIPDSVYGEKDAINDRGEPEYQSVDASFLVATLTAAIQEQQAIIESLKARLDAANL